MRVTGCVAPGVSIVRAAALIAGGIAAILPGLVAAQPSPRLNKMVRKLADGKLVVGPLVDNKSPDGAIQLSRNPDPDFVVYDMEHSAFDIAEMRVFLQFLLDPAAIARNGGRGEDPPVVVRIPAYAREMNQWMIKNILDQGAHGIMVPHVETPEQALNIVRSMRYPQKPGAADMEPPGLRGFGAGNAARYWGIPVPDYQARADLWPLDANGELVNVLLIENQLGVQNARAIAGVKGVSVIAAATGDLGVSYGGDQQAVDKAIRSVLAACKESNVPCGITTPVSGVERWTKEGFRVMLTTGR
jgi:4-hydroxy-2-oxoheptanedioate aldolase